MFKLLPSFAELTFGGQMLVIRQVPRGLYDQRIAIRIGAWCYARGLLHWLLGRSSSTH